MTIPIEIAQALLDQPTPYGATSVVTLRQLCGDNFVDDVIALAKDTVLHKKSGTILDYFDASVRALAQAIVTPSNTHVVASKAPDIKASILAHVAKRLRSK